MVDWAALRDVYGEASGIPALLERAVGSSDWNSPAWEQLWERLYHQGDVPSAGYAAIPSLAAIAVNRADVPVEPALHLLAAILATTDDSDGVRRAHAASLAAVRPVARAKLALASSDTEVVYGLQNVAAVEDLGPWQRELEGLANEELELDCPACGDHIYLEVRDEALLVTIDPDAADGAPAVGAAASEQFSGGEAELVRLAEAHDRTRVARMLTRLFSAFDCPVCGARISVAEAGTA